MAEEPKESSAFDVSDVEITSAETPKAKRKRSEAKLEIVKSGKTEKAGIPLPGVHERKTRKHASKKPIGSEGQLRASAAGEIVNDESLPMAAPEKSEVEEALEMVRETAEESAWDAKIAEAKGKIAAEEGEWEAKIAEAKAKAADEELRKKLPKIPAYKDKRVAAPPEGAEVPEYEEMTVEGGPAKPFTETEEAWFKQGEDEKHVAAQAAKQHEEEGAKIEDVRRQIAETYDAKEHATILDTDAEIDAAVKQAEAMVAGNEINPQLFNANDYRYLLVEQARIDKELEHAGWWKARKLHAELRETRKQLGDYEQQIQSVLRERHEARDEARKLPSFPARKVQAREGSGTTLHKEGGGTSIYQDKKPGLFARLFGKK